MTPQQEISLQDEALLNLLECVTIDVLIRTHAEIATLPRVMQRTPRGSRNYTTSYGPSVGACGDACEVNYSLIYMLPAAQQETKSHVSSNELEDETSSVSRAAAETTRHNVVCKVCNSDGACMLLLPCQYLCVCKPCGNHASPGMPNLWCC